ncbi:hypothetical protein [Oenococcus sp.]|uniref:DUF7671 family protein n=1 Tax=Oenococcus sp. TaxID=1979414 RepID=UPI0039E82436
MKKNQYKVQLFYGLPVSQNDQGQFVFAANRKEMSVWRTGKHTSGRFTEIGQLFLTENKLTVVILKAVDLPFKDRHQFTPLARFLDKKIDDSELNRLKKLFV